MNTIRAALVETYGEPPRCSSILEPRLEAGGEVVDVLAVGVHPVTRGAAAGLHYASPDRLPMVPGVDGVVRRADGSLAFVIARDSGTLAERILLNPARAIPVPRGADPAIVAATMNPLMSSWVVLRARVPFSPGQSVLVLGATGNAGSMAVKVARHLGAGRVVAAGRNRARLDALVDDGADHVVPLTSDIGATGTALAAVAADVDVVLDYVWGAPAEHAMRAILSARTDPAQLLDWVHIGSTGGAAIALDGAAIRSHALRISGSGFGSVSPAVYRRELPDAAAAVASGALVIQPRRYALADVEEAWAHVDEPGERTVIVL